MIKILILLLFLLVLPKQVEAKTSFSVQPSVIELTSASSSATITIVNSGESEIEGEYETIYLEAQKNGVLKPLLTPINIPGIATDSDSHSLLIPPHSSIKLTFGIQQVQTQSNIPGILFTTKPQEPLKDKTTTTLTGGIVVPILFLGNSKSSSVSLEAYNAPFLVMSNHAQFEVSVKSSSKNISQVSGVLIIKNLLGGVVSRHEIPKTYIMGGQTRHLEALVWKPTLLIGIYTSELHLKSGDITSTHTRAFLGLPFKYAFALIVLGLIVSGVYLRVRKYRS